MASNSRFRWGRVVLAALAAETLPVLLLILIVVIYGVVRQLDSSDLEAFAPRAGNWVGPIGGFLATLLFGWWAARGAAERKIAHGLAVGVATAILDFGLGLAMGDGEPIPPVFYLSNGGRVLAGFLGGSIAARLTAPAT